MQAAGGTLTLNATNRHNEPAVIFNLGRLEAANGGTLTIANTIVGEVFPLTGTITAFPGSLVKVLGTILGGSMTNQGGNPFSAKAAPRGSRA